MFRSVTATVIAGAIVSASPAKAAVVNQWVQFAPNDTVYIRAIESDPTNGCPVATLDGAPLTLSQRGPVVTAAEQAKTYFPVVMCEANVAAFGHTSATVAGVTLKMPVTNPQRLLIIGDTGCRVTAAVSGTQNCNDPAQFPLQFVSNYAASFNPDLIVHVGDFFYREQPCPTGFTGCAGNPVYDNWDAWNADWFAPAANLLAAAPLAISRGNHESCNRGAHGWFRLLDAHPYDQNAVDCIGPYAPMVGAPGRQTTYVTPYDYTEPYLVKAGQLALMMFDSSDSNTGTVDTTTKSQDSRPAYNGLTISQVYTLQLSAILATIPSATNVMYVTHKATYDIRLATVNGNLAGGDFTQQSVFNAITPGGVPAVIKVMVSGHDHQFQVVDFKNGALPPMVVVGNSGTLLDNNTGNQPQAFVPDTSGTNANASYVLPGVAGSPTVAVQATADRSEYGFTVMDANSTGYLVNVYNTSSNKQARCGITLATRTMLCSQ